MLLKITYPRSATGGWELGFYCHRTQQQAMGSQQREHGSHTTGSQHSHPDQPHSPNTQREGRNISHEPGSSPHLSCPIPVQNNSSGHGGFPSGNRAADGQTEGDLQGASGIGSIVSVLLSTAWMGWKGSRIQGFYSPAMLKKQAPSPGNGAASPGASTALGVTQHGE